MIFTNRTNILLLLLFSLLQDKDILISPRTFHDGIIRKFRDYSIDSMSDVISPPLLWKLVCLLSRQIHISIQLFSLQIYHPSNPHCGFLSAWAKVFRATEVSGINGCRSISRADIEALCCLRTLCERKAMYLTWKDFCNGCAPSCNSNMRENTYCSACLKKRWLMFCPKANPHRKASGHAELMVEANEDGALRRSSTI